jgi:hypothetical protein
VWVSNSNSNGFIMSGGIIGGNSSTGSGGGGVGLANSKFTMSGGTISGNATPYGRGGGTLLYQGGNTFAMSGGTISGNTAGVWGSGVCVDGDGGSSTFTMSGDAAVDTGNTVYLDSGRAVTLSGNLTANPAANIVSGGGAGTQVLTGDISANYTKFWLRGESNEDGTKIGSDGKIK